MPVVIKEMRVKVNVEEPARNEHRELPDRTGSQDREALIDACVEKVLEVLKREKLR